MLAGIVLSGPLFAQAGGEHELFVSPERSGPGRAERVVVINGEGRLNGTQWFGDEVGQHFVTASSGIGLALFDSSPEGPNAFGADPDLLVDQGNVLILQNPALAHQSTPGIYDVPNDSPSGGTIEFRFAGPVELQSIDLVDVCPGGSFVRLVLTDTDGGSRTYDVPDGFTNDIFVQGPPGSLTLDLRTLAPQPGVSAIATASEEPGFQPGAVVALDVTLDGSGALDNLTFVRAKDPELFARPRYAVGRQPVQTLTGDWDADGDLDLGSVTTGSNSIDLLFNHGDGTLGGPIPYETPLGPGSAVATDLDRDGFLDIAVTTAGDTLSLFTNLGHGVFGGPSDIALPDRPGGIQAADWTGDGTSDLAVTRTTGNSLLLFPNLGDGRFGQPSDVFVGSFPASIAAGDWDGDLLVDLAVVLNDGVGVFVNSGNGGFDYLATLPVLGFGFNLTAADWSGDGRPDLAVSDVFGCAISLWINPGDGLFTTRSDVMSPSPNAFTTADFDEDGHLDLGVVGIAPGSGFSFGDIRIYPNPGDGSFGAPQPETYGVTVTRDLCAGDLDGDGDADLIGAGGGNFGGDGGLVLLPNQGGALFPPATAPSALPAFRDGQCLAGLHLNDDGRLDLAVAMTGLPSQEGLVLMTNAGDGTFEAGTSFSGSFDHVLSVELDGNGETDLVVPGNASISILFHQGSGVFSTPVDVPVAPFPSRVHADDLNADGACDLLVSSESGTLTVLINRGDGTFLPAVEYPAGPPAFITTSDVDGNGTRDIVCATRTPGRLLTLINQGDGSFVPGIDLPFAGITAVAAYDRNGDGREDLVVVAFPRQLSLLSNDGLGNFTPTMELETGDRPVGVVIRDLDGDGDEDFAVPSQDEDSVRVFLDLGDGHYVPNGDYSLGRAPFAMLAEDLDGNGSVDFAAVSDDRLTVTLNLSEPKRPRVKKQEVPRADLHKPFAKRR